MAENDLDDSLPDIYTYTDFTKFLEDYQKAKQKIEKTFTQSLICKEMGNKNTRSYFRDIIKRRFNLTESKLKDLIRVFELDEERAKYLSILVDYTQTISPAKKKLLFDQLIALNHTPFHKMEIHQMEYFKSWHHSVVRACLDVYDLKNDFSILTKKITPKLSLKKIQESIELLKKLNLIEKKEEYWKPATVSLHSGKKNLQDELIKRYQAECFEKGVVSVMSPPNKPKNFRSHTISVSKEAYSKLEQKIETFTNEMRAIINKDDLPAEEVYQINVQLFPHLK